jgi:23S rRNA pseudouridine955/2504/2580 synthase
MRGSDQTIVNIPILFENDDCIVLNKPAGLAVQGGKGIGASLDSILSAEIFPRPLLVHRLDRDTSGLILAAKNKEAAAFFGRLFSAHDNRRIVKQYLAVCNWRPCPESGCIRLDLDVRGVIKKSETNYKTLSQSADRSFSVLELELGTGRMHQIRRHLAEIGNPVLGDDKYGNFALNKKLHLRRLLLHASHLLIPEIQIDVTAPLPVYFEQYII